jgi:hypothetical protein
VVFSSVPFGDENDLLSDQLLIWSFIVLTLFLQNIFEVATTATNATAIVGVANINTGTGVVGIGGTSFGTTGSGGGGGSFEGGQGGSSGNGGAGVLGFVGSGGISGGDGVVGVAPGQSPGGVSGKAGKFYGDVDVTGNLTINGTQVKTFRIDHPLDPENKYLYHSSVESPDMMNIYNGNATLDERGEAVVEMPEWFEALNMEFRYQLTAIGAPGPNLYIAEEVSNNRFKIAGGKPGMKVSWQVTGIRQDAFAKKHRVRVEEEKPAAERGYYLHPEAYNQPVERGINRKQQH